MAPGVELQTSSAGPVVVRRATGSDVARLRQVARRLEQAAHPGVVQVVASSGAEEAWELRLAHAGRPVHLLAPLPPAQVAGLAAAVAATLADLHAAGLVHGRLDSTHVLIGSHGRPVLCGFGPDADGCEPADDVAAIGGLIVELLGSGADEELVPERRWRGGSGRPDVVRRSLLLLADHACADPPSRRPSAARLAAAITEAVPTLKVDVAPGAASTPSGHQPRHALPTVRGAGAGPRPAARWAAGVLAAAVVVAGGLRSVPSGARDGSAPADAPSTAASTPPRPPATSLAPKPRVDGSARPCPPPCAPISVEGTTIRVAGASFEVGRPGDHVVVGDWDCSGSPAPAVLRPSTGEVFVFPGWAAEGTVEVTAADVVPDAWRLTIDRDRRGCDTLLAEREDGSRVPVHARARA